jgi:hypothetical protein
VIAGQRTRIDEMTAQMAVMSAEGVSLRVRIEELERQLRSNSRNSSKPPSSDGYTKPAPKSRRQRSGKNPGKQPGDPGHHLAQRPDPDAVRMTYRLPPSSASTASMLCNDCSTVTRGCRIPQRLALEPQPLTLSATRGPE